MAIYPASITASVNYANEKSDEFYLMSGDKTIPNLYYIGKGNPNAKILLMGIELAIDSKTNKDAFRDESVENPTQWKKIIDSG